MLAVLAEQLRKPPGRSLKDYGALKRFLKLRQSSGRTYEFDRAVERAICQVLGERQKWDHHFSLMTPDADLVYFNAPYWHWNEVDVAGIEEIGGYVVAIHFDWCCWHSLCYRQAVVALFSATAAQQLYQAREAARR